MPKINLSTIHGCSNCGRYRGVLTRSTNGFKVTCKDCLHTWSAPKSAESVYQTDKEFKKISDAISTEQYDRAVATNGNPPYES